MEKRKPIETTEDLIRTLVELFDEMDPETPEEVDASLREAGYDPDESGTRMKAAAERALANSPVDWRNRAPKEVEAERSRLAEFTTSVDRSRDEILEAIQQKLAQLGGQVAHAHRNLESASDEDLAEWLSELDYLIAQQGLSTEESEETD